MSVPPPDDKLLTELQERAKELKCLYQIEDILRAPDHDEEAVLEALLSAIPSGWRYPDRCRARIIYHGQARAADGFKDTAPRLEAAIVEQGRTVGRVEVCFLSKAAVPMEISFLPEEDRLIKAIADRIAQAMLHRKLLDRQPIGDTREWSVIVGLLRRTDPALFLHVTRKLIYHLFRNNVGEAAEIMQEFGAGPLVAGEEAEEESNRPLTRQPIDRLPNLADRTFELAARHLEAGELFALIQKWIREDRASFLVKVAGNGNATLSQIVDALARFRQLGDEARELSPSAEKGLRVALIRRFFSEQLDFINIAKHHIGVDHFYDLVTHVIAPEGSHGQLGGKSAGLFLAKRVLQSEAENVPELQDIRTPRTWYISADTVSVLLHYNNLEEVTEQKYKEIDQVRLEYPNIVQLLKNSHFPPQIVKGLSAALDSFGDRPLIVRSSSLLEDRLGTAFSGKYKSLFLANQGSKESRLSALLDAIAEVYASVFGPDPIGYRVERGLLDFNEEMGIMIQEVVGRKVGRYFFPLYAGVAFSRNEFRWSPRIRREDGLVRLVPGLGTRAVDRVSDDYPVLIAPRQPKLRVNVSDEEILHYSPRRMDVIDLEEGKGFTTISIPDLLAEVGDVFPELPLLFSHFEETYIRPLTGLEQHVGTLPLVATFNGLIQNTNFVTKIATMLRLLEREFHTPVDIEFASDGRFFYLLQCRPQARSVDDTASSIPKDLPEEALLFSARKFVSNGRVPPITHVVYVDPQKYGELAGADDMKRVGQAVAALNKVLPKRQFVLMGPGRWGSRGDIRLGVPVTYSDFNNTAMLIEIARRKGHYVPELSFGTHFFQDLVEASIRYLPLYPDDPGIRFQEHFFTRSTNTLADILPQYADLAETIRVIDVPKETDGRILRIAMNAELGEALGYLESGEITREGAGTTADQAATLSPDYWRWRLRMAEQIAATLDGPRFGVVAGYVFGSTKNATAGPGSDIDLLFHFRGTPEQEKELRTWLEGWSLCLAELNYLRTGYRSDGLLDIHLVTDADIVARTSFATKINAVTDAARPLKLAGG